DQTELLRPESKSLGEALRYTDNRYRGLFGGIWRAGRTYASPTLGNCFGPEGFDSVGAAEDEAWAAFGEPRKSVFEREAEVARAALAFAQPIADELGGSAHLQLAGEGEDRHVLHLFLPVSNVMNRFTPGQWFAYWKPKDTEFSATARLSDSAEPA